MPTHWEMLIDHYRTTSIEAPDLRTVTLAQWMLESGHGESRLAQEHLNFAGLKFRAKMAQHCTPIDYEVHDGVHTYCKFSSVEDFVTGYWAFINRSVYDGWKEHLNNPAGYIRFLHSRGYAGDERYVKKVLSLLGDAEELLGGDNRKPISGFTTKLAVVIGHNKHAPGAFASSPLSISEFDFNNTVAGFMEGAAPEYNFDVKLFNRKRAASTRKEIRAAYKKADQWGAELIIELHFNAAANASAGGTETLVRDRADARVIAKAVQTEMVDTFSLKNRGVKLRGPSERGGISLHASQSPTVLAEPFFGSNRDDRMRMAEIGEEALARCYLRGLRSGLGQFNS